MSNDHTASPPHRPRLLRAVIAALAVDIGATFVALMLVFLHWLAYALTVSVTHGGQPLGTPPFNSPAFLRFGLVVGTAFTLLGGFVAGRLCPSHPGRVGLVFGILTCLLSTGCSTTEPGGSPSVGLTIVANIAAFIAALLGAYLGALPSSRESSA